MTSPSELQQQLAQLREAYASRLCSRVAEIASAWDLAARATWSPETAQTVQRLAHTLAGSGATFGFADLSRTARELEEFAQCVGDQPARPSAPRLERGRHLLDALTAFAASAQPPARAVLAETRDAPDPDSISPGDNHLFLFAGRSGENEELAAHLEYFGYSVRRAADLAEFSGPPEAASPAAIIVDADTVSVEREVDALAQIRGGGTPPPLIYLSAAADPAARLSAVRSGADAYFTKPVNLSHLTDKLDLLTAQRAAYPYRILIVEDEGELAKYYEIILERAGMLSHTEIEIAGVLQQLRDWQPDLILMDLYLPQFTGLELAKVIRQQEDFVSIPIVFLSAEADVDKKLHALSLGGDDFLTKPIRPDRLVASITARAERSHALRTLIRRDGLTRLFNHTAIKEHLETEILRAKRDHAEVAYAMLDLDQFKRINDSYGHAAGDDVIRSLARLLKHRLRKADIVGRYGGEEFAVILPGATGENALRIVDDIRVRFSQVPQRAGGQTFFVTLSGGIAVFPAGGDASALTDTADRALYRAKHNGRDQIILAQAG